MSQSILKLDQLSFNYQQREIFKDLSLSIQKKEIIGVLGPNGCGKTTLLKLLTGVLQPQLGNIYLQNKNLKTYSRREIAKKIAVLPQDSFIDFPFSAQEIVLMGRAPYLGNFAWEGTQDMEIVEEAMKLTDCHQLASQNIQDLSGGERERVLLARALSQQPQILLLDEPTTHLDLKHQQQTFYLLKNLHQKSELTILIVLHDLNFAMQICSRILLLSHGKIKGDGKPQKILTTENIQEVFEVDVEIIDGSSSAKPWIQAKLDNSENSFHEKTT